MLFLKFISPLRMKQFISVSVLTLGLCCNPNLIAEEKDIASADPALAKPAPTKLTSRQRKLAEFLELELELAKLRTELESPENSYARLAEVYEQLVEVYCLPTLSTTLQYAGPPEEPICLKYLDKLVELNPDNPVAVCVRTGIDSNNCASAFAEQYVSSNQGLFAARGNVDVQAKVTEQENRAFLEETNNKLNLLQSDLLNLQQTSKHYADDPSAKIMEIQKEIEQLHLKRLGEICKTGKTFFIGKQLPIEQRLYHYTNKAGSRQADELVKLYQEYQNPIDPHKGLQKRGRRGGRSGRSRAGARPTPKPRSEALERSPLEISKPEEAALPKLWRVRYISSMCHRELLTIHDKYPAHQYITCYFDGPTSPSCIKARRARKHKKAVELRKKKAIAPKKKTKPTSPFSTF